MIKHNLKDLCKCVWDEGYVTGFKHAVIFCDVILGIIAAVLAVIAMIIT